MQKKKLLIASDCFLPRWDGIARFLAELIPEIKNDYKITVVAPDFRGSKVSIPGVDIIRIPVHKFRWGDFPPAKFKLKSIKRLVRDNDIIFSQSIGPVGMLALLYGRKFRKPVVSFIHSIEWELVPKSGSRFMTWLIIHVKMFAQWAYSKADLLLMPSADTERQMKEAGIKTKMHIARLGVDIDRFSPADDKRNAKKNVGLNPESIIIGYTGRVGREKDLGTLYRAFKSIRKVHNDVRLLIVGKGLELNSIFDSMEGVIQVPISNKIQDYLRAMDIFVMPSLTETTSLSTMEAMSCGLPVIATGVGNIKHYVKDGKNGYLFKKGDSEALAKKLGKLISNPELRKAIGSMARKTLVAEYQWKNTVREIKKALGEF